MAAAEDASGIRVPFWGAVFIVMIYAAKRDAIESEVVQALEQIGVTVERISSPGAPDLVTYRADVGIRLLECKSKVGKPTTAQRKFRIPFTTVRSKAEALAIYKVYIGPLPVLAKE